MEPQKRTVGPGGFGIPVYLTYGAGFVRVAGEGGGTHGGGAVSGVHGRSSQKRFSGAVHEVVTAAAVGVQVNESGGDILPGGIHHFPVGFGRQTGSFGNGENLPVGNGNIQPFGNPVSQNHTPAPEQNFFVFHTYISYL